MLFLPNKKHLQKCAGKNLVLIPGLWGIPQQAKMRLGSTQTLLAAMKSKNFFNGCSRNLSRFEHGYLKCRCYHSAAGNSLVGQIITGRMIPIKIACTGFFRFISVSTPRSSGLSLLHSGMVLHSQRHPSPSCSFVYNSFI